MMDCSAPQVTYVVGGYVGEQHATVQHLVISVMTGYVMRDLISVWHSPRPMVPDVMMNSTVQWVISAQAGYVEEQREIVRRQVISVMTGYVMKPPISV
jgi:hypothetical protein